MNRIEESSQFPSGIMALVLLAFASGVSMRAGNDDTRVIASLNLQEENDLMRLKEELRTVQPLMEADFFLLQEVADGPHDDMLPFELGTDLGFPYCYAPTRSYQEAVTSPRLAILSKHPFRAQRLVELRRYTLGFKSRRRYALEVEAETPRGELRILNLHLDSRINFKDRLAQLDSVLPQAPGRMGPVLIGGDFNSNKFFWLMHILPIPFGSRQEDQLVETMMRLGFATPFNDQGSTHDFFGQKLDWIFGRMVGWKESGIVPFEFSDHHLIWAEFTLSATLSPSERAF